LDLTISVVMIFWPDVPRRLAAPKQLVPPKSDEGESEGG